MGTRTEKYDHSVLSINGNVCEGQSASGGTKNGSTVKLVPFLHVIGDR